MVQWVDYKQNRQHTVVGNLLMTNGIWSPQLNNHRDLLVWLPYSYDGQRRYPVVYMQDGYNLFDAHTSFAGEWAVDETMTTLADEGLEAIVVGIPNTTQRMFEYSPYPDPRFRMSDSGGDRYVKFIMETIKPIIDADFMSHSYSWATGIAGSSMGGLISLYGYLAYPQVFGFAGVFSPSFWFGQGGIYNTLANVSYPQGKLYLDIGAREGRFGKNYMRGVKNIAEALWQKGYNDSNLRYIEDKKGQHNEESWARRLPNALRFMLPRVRESV